MDKAQDLFQSVMHHLDYAYDALGELKKIQMQGRTEERSNAVSGQQVSESLKDTDKTVFPHISRLLIHRKSSAQGICSSISVRHGVHGVDRVFRR